MDRRALLELVETLGKEFERRGMRNHLEPLRLFYLALRHQLDHGHDRSVRLSWSESMTVEWLATLRVPPYRDRYPVQPADYACTCVGGGPARPAGRSGDWSHIGKGSAITEMVFPGGARMRCGACGAKWITLDDDASGQGT